jgi:glycosyl transferase family 25
MKIFVINLPSSADRRKIMEDQLHKLGLPYEIFQAVRGADLSDEEIMAYYDKDYYNSRPDYFTPGAVGCTLSHFFIYKKMVQEKIESALILEDDMVLSKALPVLLQRLECNLKKDEVIMLFYQSYFNINLSATSAVPLDEKYNLYQVADLKWLRSTGGYIIQFEAAKKMLEQLQPFSSFPDDWKSFYERKILNGVRVVYPFILSNTYEPTTISPNVKGGGLLKKIIPFVEQHKISPFYQMLRWRRKRNITRTRQCVVVNELPVDFRENEKIKNGY